jgi:N-hydroxyarylamine O-acetyltransferase
VVAADLVDSVLDRLGFSARPAADRAGLDALYLAWCRRVPFDNLAKRTHLASGSAAPIPNGEPAAFLESWLRDGTGGTCWPSSGGLHSLLAGVGFDARRGSAAMFDNVSGPIHTHGTVLVRLEGADYWVDSSMLTERVVPLVPGSETRLDDQLHRTRVEAVEALWRVWWTHPFLDEMIGCRLLDDDVTAEHYLERYEWSRGWSPFNTSVYATRNFDGARVTVAGGYRFERRAGGVTSAPLGADRTRVLVDEFGYSEAFVAQIPADDPPRDS